MTDTNTYIVPCLFGLESFVAQELRDLGYAVQSENGTVRFEADFAGIARANFRLRCGERILLLLGEYTAETFTELFDGCHAIPWEKYLTKDSAFPVKGHSLNSKLFSIPDCQAILKKAIVERLKSKYQIDWFPETKEKVQIQFSIMKDVVRIMLDTTGEGLHKRGYRKNANAAPLRETLAAAMVQVSRYRPGLSLFDPLCGSGTIAIEAALIGANIAPGINRSFASEAWPFLSANLFKIAREEARDLERHVPLSITASDISPQMAELTRSNAQKAGVADFVTVNACSVNKVDFPSTGGLIVTNPPYGQRLLDQREARELYATMGKVFSHLSGFKYYIISSDEAFEKHFGKKADKKRKLYNGMIKCDLYQYFRG